MTRARACLRLMLLLPWLPAVSCAANGPPRPPLLPMAAAWKTLLPDFVTPPLAADSRRIYVATRDQSVRALDQTTGAVAWKVDGLEGRLSAADGTLLVRAEDGTLTSLQPRTGGVRWTAPTGVGGSLPAVIDQDRALVAGRGLAAVELASGRVLWTDASAAVTAPPVRAGARLLSGEADGTLRCRDRATGASLWTVRTGKALLAPPLVDLAGGRLYLGTTDKRILELKLDRGDRGWRWTVGADVAHAGLLLPDLVLFAPFDAVLYAIHRGGNLAWRGSLPSRPLSGPLLVSGYLLVACLENELVAFAPESGKKVGSLRTAAEIRTPPLVAGPVLALGLRDRSVIGYALPGGALAPPAVTPAAPEAPGTPPPGTPPGTPPRLEAAPPGR
ncbi:MAG: PQQ-binding-like beta-propeller repeat protein [Betaproteobacteria bacterium]